MNPFSCWRRLQERLRRQDAFNQELLDALDAMRLECVDGGGRWSYKSFEAIKKLRSTLP